jgi:predicted phage-related endonuclease
MTGDIFTPLRPKPPEWHAARRLGIGGSDANILINGDDAAIIRLWREKRGEAEPEDLTWVLPVQIGIATEELNLAWFHHETQEIITLVNHMVTSRKHPFMRATLDAATATGAVVEAKHVNPYSNMDEVVARYTPQLTHNMVVAEADTAYLSVIKGTQEYFVQKVTLDPFYADALIEQEAKFWACVQSGESPRSLPPPPQPPKPLEDMRTVDMSKSNTWAVEAQNWLQNREAAKTWDSAAKSLKAATEADVRRAWGAGVEVVRNKAGSLTVKEIK